MKNRYRMTLSICVVFFCLLAGSVSAESEVDLFTLGPEGRLSNQFYIGPKTYSGTLFGPVGRNAWPITNWNITQWGANQELSLIPLYTNLPGGWTVTSPDNRQIVNVYDDQVDGAIVTFQQDSVGSSPICDSSSEVNLNLSPNHSFVYPRYPDGHTAQSMQLGDGEWHVAFGAQVNFSKHVDQHCPQGWNVHTAILGIVVVYGIDNPDPEVPKYALFYQIVLWDSRGRKASDDWFFTQHPFGVDDTLEVYGMPQQQPDSMPVFYDIEFGDRLSGLIKYNTWLPLDLEIRNPKNWQITTAYWSSAVTGEARGNVSYFRPRLYMVK